jgi:hypothetical protein
MVELNFPAKPVPAFGTPFVEDPTPPAPYMNYFLLPLSFLSFSFSLRRVSYLL